MEIDEPLSWYELREMCNRYGLDVMWHVGERKYKVFVWGWEWPEVGPQALGYLGIDDLKYWSANQLEEFVVSCLFEAMRKGWA